MKARWGFITWTFLHSLAASIPDQSYDALKGAVLTHIKAVCSCLPCPICAKHASEHIQKVQLSHIPTRKALTEVLCAFHNAVNARTQKKQFPISGLTIYDNVNLGYVFKIFSAEMAKPGDARLMTDSMLRRMVMKRLTHWMSSLPRETYQVGANAKAGARARRDAHAGNVRVQDGKGGGGGQGNQSDLVHA
jgi:hypothetical protein